MGALQVGDVSIPPLQTPFGESYNVKCNDVFEAAAPAPRIPICL